MKGRERSKLKVDLERMGEWAVENARKINPGESKAISFTRVLVKDSLNYFLEDQRIPEASSFKYLGIITSSDLSCTDQVNYTVQKAWKALHFVTRTVNKQNRITRILPTRHQCVLFLNMGLRAGIHTRKFR